MILKLFVENNVEVAEGNTIPQPKEARLNQTHIYVHWLRQCTMEH